MKGIVRRSRTRRPKAPPPELTRISGAHRALIDHLHEPAGLLASDGTLVYRNNPLDELLETPKGTKVDFNACVSRMSAPAFRGILGRKGAEREELVLRTAGGRLFHARVSATPLEADLLCLFVQDLREDRRIKDVLSAGRLTRSILFQIGEAVAVVSSNGTIVRASHAAYQLARTCPIGRMASEILPLELTRSWPQFSGVWNGTRSLLELVLQGKSFAGIPAVLTSSKGQVRHLLVNATHLSAGRDRRPLAVFAFTDVTKVRQAQEALQQSEERHRRLLEFLPEAVLVVVDGSIVFANPAGHSLLGARAGQEVVGRRLDAFLPSKLDGHAGKELTLLRLDDSTLDVEVRTAPLVYQDRPALQVIVRDVSERKRAEEAVRELNAVLERRVAERTFQLSESIQDLKGFSYSVAHDLRAPLRAMQGFSHALLEDYGERLDPMGRDFAVRISDAARRMDALLGDLLIYSQLAQAEIVLEPVDLSDIGKTALQQQEAVLKERNAEVKVEPRLPRVLGHRPTLTVVLSNLISNAAKFTPPGVQPRIRVSATESGGRVRVSVEDNGIGIAPQHQERIFRIFERLHTREAYPGTGMGLAIVRRSLERMGGSSGVESTLGEGSRFWIELAKAP